jgi:hypothetical protein
LFVVTLVVFSLSSFKNPFWVRVAAAATAQKGLIEIKGHILASIFEQPKPMAAAEATTTSMAQPASTLNLLDDGVNVWITVNSACAHKNRLVVFLSSGRAFERANDGSWSPLEFAAALSDDDLVESVILG